MTEERDDYMRRQDAEHDMIRMRDPDRDVRRRVFTVQGAALTDRMKLFGVTGMAQTLGGGWQIRTAAGSAIAPHEVALWFAEQDAALKERLER